MMAGWRANLDVSPVLSRRALVNYLTKYISKSEIKSKDLADILQLLIAKNQEHTSAKSVIQQLYIQACCERDISAQETCHLLNGLPLVSSGGRKFVTLNLKVLDEDTWVPVDDPSQQRTCKSFIEKYMERDDKFIDESLWSMAKMYILPSGRRHAKTKEAIVQIYPKLSKNSIETNPDQYYRQQVLLFVPWKYEDQLLENFGSWENAYIQNKTLIESAFHPECDLDNVEPNESEFEEIDIDETVTTEQWMSISRMGPTQNAEQVELGRRELDVNFDWHEATKKYDKYGGIDAIRTFVQNAKQMSNTSEPTPLMPNVQFTPEQEIVLKLLKMQIAQVQNQSTQNSFALPKSVIVQGKAGTGKSLLIHAMKTLIHESLGENAFVLLGPTGVSALNINGSTIHSKLAIYPKNKELLPLKGNHLQEFRSKFEKTIFVIVDEYSMVGCNMMNLIEKRLKEAMDKEHERYGGVFIYFFGDIQQLAPVGDSPAYKDNQLSNEYINGKILYHTMDGAITLSQAQRQNDNNFLKVLDHISSGNVSSEDYNVLKQRFDSSVTSKERKSFKDAIHLYSTRKEVDDYNKDVLERLKDPNSGFPTPIARIPAQHNCDAASKGTENEAGGLKSVIYLAKHAKIMLRANLWTEMGLVNGAIGEVVDILYHKDARPPEDRPAAIVCRFDCYKGSYLCDEDKAIVIEPTVKQWKSKSGQDCVREQFPISLCYAVSIHKSQGLTLEKAYINIGVLKEMSPGLTYTALSRVKSLSGLLLKPFGLKRLKSMNKKKYIEQRMQWLEELHQKAISNFL